MQWCQVIHKILPGCKISSWHLNNTNISFWLVLAYVSLWPLCFYFLLEANNVLSTLDNMWVLTWTPEFESWELVGKTEFLYAFSCEGILGISFIFLELSKVLISVETQMYLQTWQWLSLIFFVRGKWKLFLQNRLLQKRSTSGTSGR